MGWSSKGVCKRMSRARFLVRRITEVTQTNNRKAKGIMKKTIHYAGSALAVAGALIAGLALANDKAQKLDPRMEEMMKKAEAACTPGAAHQSLEPLVGDWKAEVKFWMTPDAPPTITKGTA